MRQNKTEWKTRKPANQNIRREIDIENTNSDTAQYDKKYKMKQSRHSRKIGTEQENEQKQ
jgi:hypothetical protein